MNPLNEYIEWFHGMNPWSESIDWAHCMNPLNESIDWIHWLKSLIEFTECTHWLTKESKRNIVATMCVSCVSIVCVYCVPIVCLSWLVHQISQLLRRRGIIPRPLPQGEQNIFFAQFCSPRGVGPAGSHFVGHPMDTESGPPPRGWWKTSKVSRNGLHSRS